MKTLEEYKKQVDTMSPSLLRSFKITREELKQTIEECEEVKNTIYFEELKLLLYIRKSSSTDFMRFYIAAQDNYKAYYCSFLKLKSVIT